MKSMLLAGMILLTMTTHADARGHGGGGRTYYGGGHHTVSHGGHYAGGHGSSHRGGHYVNHRTANHYGRHKRGNLRCVL